MRNKLRLLVADLRDRGKYRPGCQDINIQRANDKRRKAINEIADEIQSILDDEDTQRNSRG